MTAGDDGLGGSLGFWVQRLHQAMRAAFERRLAAHGVSPPEWGVLTSCGRGVARPAALADALDVDRAPVRRAL